MIVDKELFEEIKTCVGLLITGQKLDKIRMDNIEVKIEEMEKRILSKLNKEKE